MVTRLDLLLGILATCCNISALSFQPRRSARLAPWKAAKSRHRMSRPENHVDEVNNRRLFFGQVAVRLPQLRLFLFHLKKRMLVGWYSSLVLLPCSTSIF
jgi:hypothetical protein